MSDFHHDVIPEELRDREQWICWRTECRECGERLSRTTKTCPDCAEKATKKPVDPVGGGFASSTDSDTWGSLDEAVEHDKENPDTDGVGFVFDGNGLVAGVDLDDCRNPETGDIDDWAAEIVDQIDSFTEVSPSGTGLHIYLFGFVPDGGNRADLGEGEIEVYDSGRYFTVTGEHVEETPAAVEQRNDALADIHDEFVAHQEGNSSQYPPNPVEEPDVAKPDGKLSFANEFDEKLEEIREKDHKLDLLLSRLNPGGYNGDTSRADLAAASKLWFWRFTERQISQIIRTYRGREKVRERDDYLKMTIATVRGGERYDPAHYDSPKETAAARAFELHEGGGDDVRGDD